jgi:hypothetical protein
MAVNDVSPPIVEAPVKRRMSADLYVLIVGVIAVAAFGMARFIYEPSYQEKQQATQAALLSEHTKVCDQLGKNGPDRDSCLKALDALYMVHQREILADSSQI